VKRVKTDKRQIKIKTKTKIKDEPALEAAIPILSNCLR